MKQAKLWLVAAILTSCSTTMMTSCSDEDDDIIVVNPDQLVELNCEKPDRCKGIILGEFTDCGTEFTTPV